MPRIEMVEMKNALKTWLAFNHLLMDESRIGSSMNPFSFSPFSLSSNRVVSP